VCGGAGEARSCESTTEGKEARPKTEKATRSQETGEAADASEGRNGETIASKTGKQKARARRGRTAGPTSGDQEKNERLSGGRKRVEGSRKVEGGQEPSEP